MNRYLAVIYLVIACFKRVIFSRYRNSLEMLRVREYRYSSRIYKVRSLARSLDDRLREFAYGKKRGGCVCCIFIGRGGVRVSDYGKINTLQGVIYGLNCV